MCSINNWTVECLTKCINKSVYMHARKLNSCAVMPIHLEELNIFSVKFREGKYTKEGFVLEKVTTTLANTVNWRG